MVRHFWQRLLAGRWVVAVGGGAIPHITGSGTYSAAAGLNGLTTLAGDNNGALPGQPGIVSTIALPTS